MSKPVGKYSLLTSFLLLSFVPASLAQVPQVNHVFVVLEENSNYTNVIGNPAMPYLNSLVNQYGLATNYFADTHPSIGNYFMLTTGQILTNDDGQTPSSFPVTVDNLVRELLAAGKPWKSYAESLPSVGYLGGNTGQYAVRHNPFPYFSDVQNSTPQQQNLVPFEDPAVGFAHDLANNAFPNFSFIVPNLCSDAHDCPLPTADAWLQAHIDPLLKSAVFQNGGLLVIVFDESDTDNTHGGGHIPLLVISPKGKMAFQSTTLYQHESTLRMICEAAGCAALPGAAAQAPDMAEFFGNPPPPSGSDFGLSATPASQNVTQGGSASYTLGISPSGGFTGTVSLSASGLPSGATATFSPSAATTSSTMSVTTTAATPPGSFPVTISGTSGSLTHTASVTLVVNAAVVPDFRFSPSSSSQSLAQGASTSYTVNITPSGGFTGSVNFSASGAPSGATVSFSPNPAPGSSTTMTVSTSATTATGSFPVTITGTSGSLTHTASVTLVVNSALVSDFRFSPSSSSQSVVQGASTSYTVNITPSGGFTGSVNFSASGAPNGATVSFNPNPAAGSSTTMTVTTTAATATGSFPLTITGTSGTLTHTASVTLVVNSALVPDFRFSPSSGSQSVMQGASTSYTVNITPSGGFTGSVNFSASGAPSGATISFSPNPTAGSSTTMTVSTTATIATGSFPLTITGTSGTLTHIASSTLVVTAAAPTVTAAAPTVTAAAPTLGGFSVSATPPAQPGTPHTTVKYMVTVASSGGYTGTIGLHVQGLPRGAKASFSPATMQNAGSSTLTVSLGESVRTRKYQLTIVGRWQHLRRKTSVVLTTVEQQSASEATGGELDDD